MCGIAGYIGKSTQPKISYKLITRLFDFLELRGIDASGVWGTETGGNGRVIYHKEPVPSSKFIKRDFWKSLKGIKMDTLLVHSRATSRAGGDADSNKNNHPFVSSDKKIGVVHNGTLDESDYLKTKYEIFSETDSECLLRIFEHGMESPYALEGISDDLSLRINGIRDIWRYITIGAMAVAIGERVDDYTRNLFLFRNQKRPLWVADLRDLLGQVFFFSTPDIWYSAINSSGKLKNLLGDQYRIISVPINEVWHFKIDKENPTVTQENFFRFPVKIKNLGEEFQAGEMIKFKRNDPQIEVITNLTENEDVVDPKHEEDDVFDGADFRELSDSSLTMTDHVSICKDICQLSDSISTTISNLCLEGSMHYSDYEQSIITLDKIQRELEAILMFLPT